MMQRTSKPRDNLPVHEELLLDYAQRLRLHAAGRRAVRLHLSKLKPQNRRAHHLRIAASAFDALLRKYDGQLFRLRTGDMVVVCKDATVADLDEVVLKLRYLFSEDPLAYGDSDEDGNVFCTWYEMAVDHEAFLADARHALDLYRSAIDRDSVQDMGAPPGAAAAAGTPMDPARLARLEAALMTADLTGYVRRQAACAVLPGQPVRPIFNEVFVSIDELRRRIMPDVEIGSNRWLFQHLTEQLDRRVLRFLPDIEGQVPLTTSINMNLSTILSDDFQVFDRDIRLRTRKSFILEIQPIDLFADLASYFFARDYLRERGFKICLDGLNHLSVPLLRRDDLGFDFVKVQWSSETLRDQPPGRREQLAEAIRSVGAARVILCRCDDEQAVAFGHAVGISLFQGRHIDRLLTQ